MPSRNITACLFIAMIAGGCTIANPLKYYERAYADRPYDAVIVPGVELENGSWSGRMKYRMLWAVHLYERGVTNNIICSGSAVRSPYVEGEVMRLYAIAMGVPAEHVFAETKAEHSTENLYYGWKLARSLGFQRIALASDPFQTKTLKSFNRKMHRKLGATVALIPAVEDTVKTLDQTDPVIDPAPAFVEGFVPLNERVTRWHGLRGTLGKNIDWDAP